MQASIANQSFAWEFFMDFQQVPFYQQLLLLEQPKTKKLGVHFLKQQKTKNIQNTLMQLTLLIGDDDTSELTSFMTDVASQRENLKKLSQYYFFLECWRQKAETKGESAKQIRYQKAIDAYFQQIMANTVFY